jgi:putative ABC transport system permease protein
MFVAAIRDLIWRRRRFAIAMIATALVMSMSLVMSGLSASFPSEINRLLNALGGEQFLAVEGANGPFYPGSVVFGDERPEGSGGVLFASATVPQDGEIRQVTVFGVEPGKLGDPGASKGTPLTNPGDAVVSKELGADIGDPITIGSTTFTITGLLSDVTMFGGQPLLFLSLDDVQLLFAAGQPVATFIITPPGTTVPFGKASFDRDDAFNDLLRPLSNARNSILFVTILLWIVAACIVGSVVFLSAMERTRDFAVFKATGASTRGIAGGLVMQAVAIAAVAALIAILLSLILAPLFPMPVQIPLSAIIRLPLIAIGVGVLASLAGLKRVLSIPPGMAFGGAT